MKRMITGLTFLLALVGSVAVAHAGGGGGHYVCGANAAPVSQTSGGTVGVAITDNCFGPVVQRVAPGTEVRWTNKGNAIHNIADITKPTEQPAMLHSGTTLTMTFNEPGVFMYHCSIHPGMMGALFIGDDASQPANPDFVAAQTSASVLPPKVAPPVDVTAPAIHTLEGDYGVPVQAVLLMALVVGIVAGGGSTWLVHRLDDRS